MLYFLLCFLILVVVLLAYYLAKLLNTLSDLYRKFSFYEDFLQSVGGMLSDIRTHLWLIASDYIER